MRAAGIRPLVFTPPSWDLSEVNDRVHEKIMVIDSYRAIVGGANICDEYMSGREKKPWHDLELHIEGPLASRVQARFDETWNWMSEKERRSFANVDGIMTGYEGPARPNWEHPPIPLTPVPDWRPGNSAAVLLYSQPYQRLESVDPFSELYVSLVDATQSNLLVYAPYLIPPPRFRAALLAAARRGVRVIVMTNSAIDNDLGPLPVAASIAGYGELLAAGIELREYSGTTLHAKAMLIDGTTLLVGSHNFTARSFEHNGEAGILTDDVAAVTVFEQAWSLDIQRSNRVLNPPVLNLTDPTVRLGIWMGERGLF